MAVKTKEMLLICRFCLSRDEVLLIPIKEILDSSLTMKDLHSFTGVYIEANHPNQRTVHLICFECVSKLKMSAAFKKICMSNDSLFRQLWWRSRGNSKNDTTHDAEYRHVSETDPLEVEFLEDDTDAIESSTVIQQDLNETQQLDRDYQNRTEEPPIENEDICESNNSDKESRLMNHHDIGNELAEQSVVTNTAIDKVCEDDTLYSANYIALGEPYSDNEEPDWYHDEVSSTRRNNSCLKFIRSIPRGDPNSMKKSILFRRTSRQRGKPLCETCGKIVTNLASHAISHTEEFNYMCPYCPNKMKQSSYLARHIQAVHFKTVVKSCTTCNMHFTHYTTYRSHMHTEHGIGKLHECLVCSRGFPDACRLRKHVKRFHNTEEYDCEDCDKIFKSRDLLERHRRRVHTKEPPYECSQCPKQFKCARYRKKHELAQHSGIVFECSLCGKSFRYKYMVNAHIRKMHPDASSETETTQLEAIAYSETSNTELEAE